MGDVVYVARSNQSRKLHSRFSNVRYVIIEFQGRDTCQIVNTLDGQKYEECKVFDSCSNGQENVIR